MYVKRHLLLSVAQMHFGFVVSVSFIVVFVVIILPGCPFKMTLSLFHFPNYINNLSLTENLFVAANSNSKLLLATVFDMTLSSFFFFFCKQLFVRIYLYIAIFIHLQNDSELLVCFCGFDTRRKSDFNTVTNFFSVPSERKPLSLEQSKYMSLLVTAICSKCILFFFENEWQPQNGQ